MSIQSLTIGRSGRLTGQVTSDRWFRRSLARISPRAAVLAFCVFHFLLWGLTNSFFNIYPPADNLEQLVWSQDLALTYYKHPPLPSWLLRGLAEVFGFSLSLTYLIGAACAAISIWLLYELACEFVSGRRAAVAAMLTAAIIYYNYLSSSYNHNTVQLPFAIACIAMFYRAQQHGRWRDWCWLGVATGLMVLTKYSAVLLFASFGLFLLVQRRLGEAHVWGGIGLAAGTAAVVLSPHLLGVLNGDAGSVEYARHMMFPQERGILTRLDNVQEFIGTQAGRLLPALLLLAMVMAFVRRRAPAAPALAVEQERFLWIVGFGPLVLALLFALLTGARLLTGWGTTFFALFGLWLVTRRRFRREFSRRVLLGALCAGAVLQTALAGAVVALDGVVISPLHRKNPQPLLPAALAPAAVEVWNAVSQDDVPVIITDISTGGLLVNALGKRVHVVDANTDAFTQLSRAGHHGHCALVLTNRPPSEKSRDFPPKSVRQGFDAGIRFGEFTVQRTLGGAGWRGPLTYYWALATVP